jgi:hypothetical protein
MKFSVWHVHCAAICTLHAAAQLFLFCTVCCCYQTALCDGNFPWKQTLVATMVDVGRLTHVSRCLVYCSPSMLKVPKP